MCVLVHRTANSQSVHMYNIMCHIILNVSVGCHGNSRMLITSSDDYKGIQGSLPRFKVELVSSVTSGRVVEVCIKYFYF